jgi:hypothetical protein
MIVFSGYIGQEDDLYFWREAFNVHFLGGGFNHVIHLSTPNESGEYLFYFFTFITLTSFLLNIGDNVQPKCKGRVNDDTLENEIALEFVCSVVGVQ